MACHIHGNSGSLVAARTTQRGCPITSPSRWDPAGPISIPATAHGDPTTSTSCQPPRAWACGAQKDPKTPLGAGPKTPSGSYNSFLIATCSNLPNHSLRFTQPRWKRAARTQTNIWEQLGHRNEFRAPSSAKATSRAGGTGVPMAHGAATEPGPPRALPHGRRFGGAVAGSTRSH